MSILIILTVAYLLGSIPFGLVLTKVSGHGDLRKIGSGNIGATNVLRTGKKSLAALTLLLDGGKGALAVLLAMQVDPHYANYAGLAAFIGHLYPCWLRFKGGKGVATGFGIFLVIAWPVALGAALIWLVTAVVSRYSSLSALLATVASPLLAWMLGYTDALPLILLLALFVVVKHRNNIKRLVKRTEPKIGRKEAK